MITPGAGDTLRAARSLHDTTTRDEALGVSGDGVWVKGGWKWGMVGGEEWFPEE